MFGTWQPTRAESSPTESSPAARDSRTQSRFGSARARPIAAQRARSASLDGVVPSTRPIIPLFAQLRKCCPRRRIPTWGGGRGGRRAGATKRGSARPPRSAAHLGRRLRGSGGRALRTPNRGCRRRGNGPFGGFGVRRARKGRRRGRRRRGQGRFGVPRTRPTAPAGASSPPEVSRTVGRDEDGRRPAGRYWGR